MTPTTVNGIDELKELVGQTIGPSDWREVSQDDINKFAEVSGDHQWIHVDIERAKTESPFGTTIAHGNLTLCMLDGFRHELFQSEGFKMGINYGWNKVRYTAPVPSGARIRASLETLSVDDVGDGWPPLLSSAANGDFNAQFTLDSRSLIAVGGDGQCHWWDLAPVRTLEAASPASAVGVMQEANQQPAVRDVAVAHRGEGSPRGDDDRRGRDDV